MDNKNQIDQIIKEHCFTDYKWIIPRENIIVAQWVRFRCQFGCKNYGKNGSCPPAVPSVEECRKMIYEYENAIIFHFSIHQADNDDTYKLVSRLSELERAIFLAGNYKTFLLQYSSCVFCKDCIAEGTRTKCIHKDKSRPGADAMAIDVYQTAHNVGYPIQVVKDHNEITNRFAFLLID
ncbi:metal-binding protein [Spirochaetia bacterium]|nr:metal-binding protein [Spirochaetia bacterium]